MMEPGLCLALLMKQSESGMPLLVLKWVVLCKVMMIWVRSVAYSPDGSKIVSGSHDKTLRIWDPTFDSPMNNTLIDKTESLQAHNNWNLSSDGWITFPNCPYGIIWIPPQFRRPLWRPQNLCIISQVGYTKLSFSDCVFDKEWFHCIVE
ncbi:hypothetical protein BT96DRAFT_489732 [Gymnopus androsaceus JB14]|uniref:Uncharacterized protein n=1 Tax=Gymnopus androsaceus JB14 TaxID=1447944 RepID=A0A6A4I3M6_9AGAR|nr:hypothetical protein BT96DRAFT_489732 [Gymnopus androsaceus JB14]